MNKGAFSPTELELPLLRQHFGAMSEARCRLSEPEAAVALLLVQRAEVMVVFIKKRVAEGYDWSGHMAFPGGRIEDDDESPLAAALRETEEELSIPATSIEPLTSLGLYNASTRLLLVEAFVMIWQGKDTIVPRQDEVDFFIEVPLAQFLETHLRRGFAGQPYQSLGLSLEYPLGDEVVWGLSARMLHTLLEGIIGHDPSAQSA